jgi:myo-inositol-1-phosphate synthase
MAQFTNNQKISFLLIIFKEMIKKLGVWIIGIYGNISSLVIGGSKLLAEKIISPIGVLTEDLEEFKKLDLINFDQIVFGGHDIRKYSIAKSFHSMREDANIKINIKNEIISNYFDEIEKNVKIGISVGCSNIVSQFSIPNINSPPLIQITEKIIKDLEDFKKENDLQDVIVVNLSSTEPPIPKGEHTETIQGFEEAINNDRKDLLSASTIYTYASFKNKFPFINFTPSTCFSIPALINFGKNQGICFTGNDGKTGETLVKSILSLVFKYRALNVLAWQSYNMLGNLDGKVLQDPKAKLSKEITKDAVVPSILGYKPYTNVAIDYVPSLNDWKVAMDYIQFEGFLGTKMNMQFTWNGCDSVLAAPLVLDLIRLVEFAHRRNETGILSHLALFFKQPMGTEIIDLAGQRSLLMDYLHNIIRGS